MKNPTSIDGAAPRVLPVFPLPNTVFFPRTTLPLHVFEPRYRAMVRDVVAGAGLIVVSLATGDGFQRLGTVGRIIDLEPLPGGLFNLRLEGLERVALVEVRANTPYRQVAVESRPERVEAVDASTIDEARLELLASYGILRRMVLGDEPILLHSGLEFEAVVNTACAGLPIDAASRQRLLDEDSLMDRQRLGLDLLSTIIEVLPWLRAAPRGGPSVSWPN